MGMYMQKKIDFILKVGMILFSIFIICYFVFGMKAEHFIINDIPYSITQTESLILSFIFALIFLFVFFSVPPFGFITYYLIYRTVTQNKIRKNAKFERHNLEYCREHLNKLSPALLSYLDNFELEYEKDICAHILKLIYEKHIVINNNQLIITNKNSNTLSESDLFVLNSIKNKNINVMFKNQYERIIEKEAKEQKLIVNKDIETKNFIIQFFGMFFLIAIIGQLALFFIIKTINQFSIILIFIDIILMFLPAILIVYLLIKSFTIFHSKSNLIRTKHGNKILKNALDLKKFLQDFSTLNNCSWKEVYTRDYYLIYAVVFAINKQIPKEIMEMLK